MEKAAMYESAKATAEQIVNEIKDELLELETKQTALKDRHNEIAKKTRNLSHAYSLGFDPLLEKELPQEIRKTKDRLSKAEERLSRAALSLDLNQIRLEREALKEESEAFYSRAAENIRSRVLDLNQIRLEREALKEERLELEAQKNQFRETMESFGFWMNQSDSLDEIILLKPHWIVST